MEAKQISISPIRQRGDVEITLNARKNLEKYELGYFSQIHQIVIFVAETDLFSTLCTTVCPVFARSKTSINIAYSASWQRRNDEECPKNHQKYDMGYVFTNTLKFHFCRWNRNIEQFLHEKV